MIFLFHAVQGTKRGVDQGKRSRARLLPVHAGVGLRRMQELAVCIFVSWKKSDGNNNFNIMKQPPN